MVTKIRWLGHDRSWQMRVGEVGLGLGVMDVLGRPQGSFPENFKNLIGSSIVRF